jgi:hypothetical protein
MNGDLLSEIDKFLAETGMSEAAFCRAVGNGRLFERLRSVGKRGKRGRLWPENEMAVRAYMLTQRQKRKEVA